MRKTLIAAAVATALAAPTLVLAADPTPEHTFAPNVGVVSDYLFRGISQTRHAPALQAGLDYTHSSGLYAGVWASTITWVKDYLGKGRTEIDLYGGYKNSFAGDFTYDVGLIHYNYPGKGAATGAPGFGGFGALYNPNTTEVYGAIGYKWLTVKYSQAISKNFIGFVPTSNAAGGFDYTKNSGGSSYLELNAAYDLGDGWGISGHVGRQKVKNVLDATATAVGTKDASYSDWNIGVTKDVGFGVVGLTYSDTNVSGTCTAAGGSNPFCWGEGMMNAAPTGFKDVAKGTAVLSFKKTF
jgi:uncharacterized protein (TIGR02001 family)